MAAAGLAGTGTATADDYAPRDFALFPLSPWGNTPSPAWWPAGIRSAATPTSGHHMDRHMKEYFTAERTVEFLLDCEQQGSTPTSSPVGEDTTEVLRTRAGARLEDAASSASTRDATASSRRSRPPSRSPWSITAA